MSPKSKKPVDSSDSFLLPHPLISMCGNCGHLCFHSTSRLQGSQRQWVDYSFMNSFQDLLVQRASFKIGGLWVTLTSKGKRMPKWATFCLQYPTGPSRYWTYFLLVGSTRTNHFCFIVSGMLFGFLSKWSLGIALAVLGLELYLWVIVSATNGSTTSTWFLVGSTIRMSLMQCMTKTPVATWDCWRLSSTHWWHIARELRYT